MNFKWSLRDVRKNSSDRTDCCDCGSVTATSGLLLFAHFQLNSKGLFWHESSSTAVPMNQRTVCPSMPIPKLCYDRQPGTHTWNSHDWNSNHNTTNQFYRHSCLVCLNTLALLLDSNIVDRLLHVLRSVVRLHLYILTVAQYWQTNTGSRFVPL